MSEWATALAAAMMGGQSDGALETKLYVAQVVGISPFTIQVNGQPISQHLHISSSFIYRAELTDGQLDELFRNDDAITPSWLTFLKEYHKQAVVRVGGQVVVLQIGIDFYVMEVIS